MNLDAPEVEEPHEPLYARQAELRRDFARVIKRAQARGELPEDAAGTPTSNVVMGAILSHFLGTPHAHRPKLNATTIGVAWIVDVVLAGIAAVGPKTPRVYAGEKSTASRRSARAA